MKKEQLLHPIETFQHSAIIERHGVKKTLGGIAAGALILAGVGYGIDALVNVIEGNSKLLNPNEFSTKNGYDDCSGFESSNSSSNPNTYFDTAFLPKPLKPVNSSETAQIYVNQLFGKTGPLAGKNGDVESLAAIMSTVVVPAEQGAISDPNYIYVDEFNQESARYHVSGGEGLKAASNDCQVALDTIVQVEGYNASWAKKGAYVSQFAAVRNNDNDIVGMEFKKVHADTTLQGIDLKINDSTKGLKGFTEVLIATNPSDAGEIFAAGTLAQPNSSNEQHNQGSSGSNSKNSQGTGESGGKSGSKGNKNGKVNSGNGNGPTGSAPTPGTGNLPGPGKGGGEGEGPKPTTTTTEPQPTTTTTEPQPTTTTTEPQPTPTPTTTTTIPTPTTTTTIPTPTTTTLPTKGSAPTQTGCNEAEPC